MCLTIKYKTREESREARRNPLVARKDIIVFKRLKKRPITYILISPYQNKPYRRNNLYTVPKLGLNKEPRKRQSYEGWKIIINQGLHSHLTLKIAQRNLSKPNYESIFKMTIPKGSIYYKDKNDIVSNQLFFGNKKQLDEFRNKKEVDRSSKIKRI